MKLNSVAALLKFYLFSLVNMEASKSVTLRTSMFEKKNQILKRRNGQEIAHQIYRYVILMKGNKLQSLGNK